MVNGHLLVVVIIVSITGAILLFISKGAIQGVELTNLHKAAIVGVEALIGLWWTETFNALLWCLGFASIVIVGHAVCHPEATFGNKFSAKVSQGVSGVKEGVKDLEGKLKKAS